MNEIDWSKAPKWAKTVIRSSGNDGRLFWAEAFGTVSRRQRISGYKDTDAHGANMTIEGHMWTLVETRPMAWTGEGLPPVGVECEANFVGEWKRFEMRYYGEAYVVFKTAFEVQRARHDFDTCGVKFRPVRTPEQIAADEREAAIDRMCKISAAPHMLRRHAEALYDAGYRKP